MTQINWSGHTWSVRTGTGDPGPNSWSDSPNNVFVDNQGNLHLKITNVGGKWYCAEIYSTDTVGYGTYTVNMVTNPSNPPLDNSTVIGLFYYLDDNDELDIEYARWGNSSNNNIGKFTVQPLSLNAAKTYPINVANTVNKFVWQSNGNVNFSTTDSSGNVIATYNYTGSHKTNTGGTFAINLWLYNASHPSDNQEKELILSSFAYPGSTPTPVLTTIDISPTSVPVNIGDTQQLTTACIDQNNNVMTCPTLTWVSNNISIATVNSSGLVTGVATGSANITASAGGKISNISTVAVATQPITELLRGVNWSGWEYNNAYGLSLQKLADLKNNWNVNVVRFSFNRQDYMSNNSYRQHIIDAVNWCKSLGITAIIEQQWESQSVTLSPLPNKAQSVQLWSSIAQDPNYQNNPLVWFDLWNEPHDCTIAQWKDIADACATAIRTYANNTILVAGIAWADDVRSWHGNYLTQSNIIYSRHNYGPAYGGASASQMDNNEGVLLKDGKEVFIGEFGCCDSSNCSCNQSAIDNIKNVLFPWLDGKTRGAGIPLTPLGFTAWSVCDTPLLCNPRGDPSSPTNYGIVVRNELSSVPPIPVLTTITISPASISINGGATQQLTSVCRDQNNNVMACPTLTWTSNNTSIVAVNSSGLVTGVATGSANVTASAGGKVSNVSTVTVTTQPVLTTIAISPTTVSINIGATQQLVAICRDQNNNVMTCPILAWSSSNTSVATVNSTGLVTGVSAGNGSITASAGGKISNVSTIVVTTQPVNKIFIVSTIGCPTITGVMVIKSPVGDRTADEACQDVCNILKTIS